MLLNSKHCSHVCLQSCLRKCLVSPDDRRLIFKYRFKESVEREEFTLTKQWSQLAVGNASGKM